MTNRCDSTRSAACPAVRSRGVSGLFCAAAVWFFAALRFYFFGFTTSSIRKQRAM